MKIRIWGARGSIPISITSREIEEKLYQAIHNMPPIDVGDSDAIREYIRSLPPLVRGTAGGSTTCVEIQAGDDTIIIDAGTGLYRLGLELLKGPCGKGEGVLHFVFTHPHWDHIQGFPMFIPAFIPGNHFYFHSIHDIETALLEQQRFKYFPVSLRPETGGNPHMNAKMTFIRHEVGEAFEIGRIQVLSSRNTHPGTAYAYRFADSHSVFVFASDAEYKDLEGKEVQERIKFFQDADAVLFDAQYGLRDSWENKVDFGHSSAMIGVHMARHAGVKRLILTHHDPAYTDQQLLHTLDTAVTYQAQDPNLPACKVLLAYEGLTLDLVPDGAVDIQTTSEKGSIILTASATFDQSGVYALRGLLSQISAGEAPANSVIDLSQTEQLTPAGLKALVEISGMRPEPIVLANASVAVQETIRLAGYGDYFAIYPSVEAAVQAVEARRALELPGQIIGGRYQILAKLDQGRFGTVLKAQDQETDQVVALKLLSPALTMQTVERVHAQIERVRLIQHPNIVPILDWGQEGDRFYLVESWTEGETLADILEKMGSLPQETLETLVMDLLLALEKAHARGVIHGHLHPNDIFLTEGHVKLGGFGLGQLDIEKSLLQNPMVFLEASFLSPERILGQLLDARSDLYALGVLLYRLFTGQFPFVGTETEILQAHLEVEPVPPEQLNPEISRPLAHLIIKLLAKNPTDRYPSAREARNVAEGLLFGAGDIIEHFHLQLVGRETQLDLLIQIWQRVLNGQGNLVFIRGEPGVGKTSLALEAATRCKAPVVLVGRSQLGGDQIAYQPFIEVLNTYLATVPPELEDETLRPLLANFAQLMPEVHRQMLNLPEPAKLEPEAARLRLYSSLTRFIQFATAARPWVLILDDLHWMDQASLDFLRFLGRQLPHMNLLVIGTYRDTEVTEGHPFHAVLRELNRAPGYKTLDLERLDKPAVRKVLTRLWDSNVPPDLISAIYQRTEGNPLFVEEVARGLEADRLIYPNENRWIYPQDTNIRLPASVAEAVEGRLHYLDAETRDVLSQAAVLGERFQFGDVVTLSGLTEWEILDHLDLALARGIIQEIEGGDALRFRHGEIHHVIYEDLGSLRRRRLHRRAGETLEEQTRSDVAERADELARHFREAGEPDKARFYSIAAGKQAQAAYANDAALYWYEQALQMTPSDDLKSRFDLMLAQIQVYHLLGKRGEQLKKLEALDLLAERIEVSENKIVVGFNWAKYYEATSDLPMTIQKSKQVISLAQSAENLPAEASGYLDWGKALWQQGQYDLAQECLQKALAIYHGLDDKPGVGHALRLLGQVSWRKGDFSQARRYSEQAYAHFVDTGDNIGKGDTLNDLGIIAQESGDYIKGQKHFWEALEIYREIGAHRKEAFALGNLGIIAEILGDYDRGREYYEQALSIFKETGDRRLEGLSLTNIAGILVSEGNYNDGRRFYELALEIARGIGSQHNQAFILTGIGNAFIGLGQLDEAIDACRESILIREKLGQRHLLMESYATMSLAMQIKGLVDQAQEVIEIILNYLDEGGSLDGTDAPFRIYLRCYEVLHKGKNPQAVKLLKTAYDLLQERAAKIPDENAHNSFLENVPWHGEIVKLWESRQEK